VLGGDAVPPGRANTSMTAGLLRPHFLETIHKMRSAPITEEISPPT
jgi:hypothetical protein